VIFFVFFGISITLSAGINIFVIAIICILAIVSKLVSGVLTGIALYGIGKIRYRDLGQHHRERGIFHCACSALRFPARCCERLR